MTLLAGVLLLGLTGTVIGVGIGTLAVHVIDAALTHASPLAVNEGASPKLSGRDREVLTLLTWGYTNQQVADELDVSITTVKTYIHFAYLKIGVTRRTQAVVWGVRNGLATISARGADRGCGAPVITRQKHSLVGLTPDDLAALQEAWRRFEEAQAERESAFVALYHLCSELGMLSTRHLTVVPDVR